jgi:hypothetical protein
MEDFYENRNSACNDRIRRGELSASGAAATAGRSASQPRYAAESFAHDAAE